MKKIALAALLLPALPAFVSAQVVRRSAELTKKGGAAILRDSVHVDVQDLSDGTYTAHLHVFVHRDFVEESATQILLNAPLLTREKDTLGSVIEPIQADTLWPSQQRRMSRYYEAVLSGTVSSSNIHRRSLPTPLIESFFSTKQVGDIYGRLTDLLEENGWKKTEFDVFEAWTVLFEQEKPWSPRFNAIFVFKDNQPYCLINNGEPFTYAKLKGTQVNHQGAFYYFQKPNPRLAGQLEDLVYYFIPL